MLESTKFKKIMIPLFAFMTLSSVMKAELLPTLSLEHGDPKEKKEISDTKALKYFFENINNSYGLTFDQIYNKFRTDSYIKSKFIQFLSDKEYEILNPTEHQKVIQIVEFSLENGHMFFKDESLPFRIVQPINFSPPKTMKLGVNNKLTDAKKEKIQMYVVNIPKGIMAQGLTIHYSSETIICLIDRKNGIEKNLKGEIVGLSGQALIVLTNEYMHQYLLKEGFNSISQCGTFRDEDGNIQYSLRELELITQFYSYQLASDPNHIGRKHDFSALSHDYINKRDNLELFTINKVLGGKVSPEKTSGSESFNDFFLPKEDENPYLKGLLYFNKVISEELPLKYDEFWNDIHTIPKGDPVIKKEAIDDIINKLFETITDTQREKIEHKLMLKIDQSMDLLQQNELMARSLKIQREVEQRSRC